MPAGNTYEAIATQTLGSAAATVTFSSIPQTYTDLVLVLSAKVSTADNSYVRLNSDTGTNYSWTALWGDGTSRGSARSSNTANGIVMEYFAYPSSSEINNVIMQFNNYSNTTTFKTVLSRANHASLGVDSGSTWSIGSTFSLYGIKAA